MGVPKPREAAAFSAATSSAPPSASKARPPSNGSRTQRERMVGSSRCGFAVSNSSSVFCGGSSRVFKKAFAAWSFIRSASVMTPTLQAPPGAARCRVCSRLRISSTPMRRDFMRGRTMRIQPLSSSSSGGVVTTTGSPKRSNPPALPPPFTSWISRAARFSFPLPCAPLMRNACANLCRWWAEEIISNARSAKYAMPRHRLPNPLRGNPENCQSRRSAYRFFALCLALRGGTGEASFFFASISRVRFRQSRFAGAWSGIGTALLAW